MNLNKELEVARAYRKPYADAVKQSKALPPWIDEALTLREDGYTHKMIAKTLGVSASAVSVAFAKYRKQKGA